MSMRIYNLCSSPFSARGASMRMSIATPCCHAEVTWQLHKKINKKIGEIISPRTRVIHSDHSDGVVGVFVFECTRGSNEDRDAGGRQLAALWKSKACRCARIDGRGRERGRGRGRPIRNGTGRGWGCWLRRSSGRDFFEVQIYVCPRPLCESTRNSPL